jgi:hypothetical protein
MTTGAEPIELYPSDARIEFVAAVLCNRTRQEIDRDPDYEGFDLREFPDITWWRYDVLFEPERVIEGQWDLAQPLAMMTRARIGGSRDRRWAAFLGRSSSGRLCWFHEFVIRRNFVFTTDPEPERLGPEAKLGILVRDYLRDAGFDR